MSFRDSDLRMLGDLLGLYADELTADETEAFAGMRFDLTAYEGQQHHQHQLTEKQRLWVKGVHHRIIPEYANLVSQGLCPKGTPTAESKALDAMLAGPKVTRPPPRRRDDD